MEKYFVASFNGGFLEAVLWCETLDEAKVEKKKRAKQFPEEEIIVGERIE
jgi:hypothetical protein